MSPFSFPGLTNKDTKDNGNGLEKEKRKQGEFPKVVENKKISVGNPNGWKDEKEGVFNLQYFLEELQFIFFLYKLMNCQSPRKCLFTGGPQ